MGKYGTAREATYYGACLLHAGKLRIQTRTQNMYNLLLISYANAPRCYLHTYISSIVNNDMAQFEFLVIQFSSPVKRQVANYNNNNNGKNLPAYPAELWRRLRPFQSKNKTKQNTTQLFVQQPTLSFGHKKWDVRNCKM